MASPFRFNTYDAVSGAYLGNMPYSGYTFGMPQINTPGPFSGGLQLADPRVQNKAWQTCTHTGNRFLVIDLLGTIVWAGMIWDSDYDDADPKKVLKVTGQSTVSYLQHRVQAADYSTLWAAGADPMAIVQRIVTDAFTLASIMGGITVKLNPSTGEGGPQATPSYPGTSLQTLDSMVSILAQMGYGDGFDYSFDVTYSSPGVPALTMNIWYPRQGRTADQTQLVILQRHLISFRYPVSSQQQATVITETGSGTGGVQPVQATASLPQYPRLERAISRTQVNDVGTLGNIAAGDLWLYSWPVITPTVTLPLGLPDSTGRVPPGRIGLGQFYLGDDLTWKIDPLAGVQQGYGTTPRFPQGMNYEWRINGWTVTVPDQQGQIPTLALNLCMPPGEGVPAQPPL